MPALDYPELQGMPEGCTVSPPWVIDPLPVAAAYNGYAYPEAVVMLDPLVDIDILTDTAYDLFAGDDNYDLDIPGVSPGYETPAEMEGWGLMRAHASATKNNTAFYHPDAKEKIVELATEAFDLLHENASIYDSYAEGPFPLGMPDSEVAPQVDPDSLEIARREFARQQIRDNYRKAVYLLWCAMYGAAQSRSFHRNRTIFLEEQGTMDGPIMMPPGEGMDPVPAEPLPPPLEPMPAQPRAPLDPIPARPQDGGPPPPPPPLDQEEPPFDPEAPPFEDEPPPKKKAGGGTMAAAAVVLVVGAIAIFSRR